MEGKTQREYLATTIKDMIQMAKNISEDATEPDDILEYAEEIEQLGDSALRQLGKLRIKA